MKQKVFPATTKFRTDVYPRLSPEGKRKADLLFNEYALDSRDLTPEEVDEAVEMLIQIVKAHTVKAPPSGSWAPSWGRLLTMVTLFWAAVGLITVGVAVILKLDWLGAFLMSTGGAALVLGILVALMIVFYKAKGTE